MVADLMQLVRRVLGRDPMPIVVPPIPPVPLTPPASFRDQERRLEILEDRVNVQTARLSEHLKRGTHGAN